VKLLAWQMKVLNAAKEKNNMDFKNILRLILSIIVALGIGGAIGYFYAPDKIKTVEKVVEKTIKEKDTKNTKKYDPITGKLIEEIAETKDKETNIESTSKTTEKSKSQKQWAVKGGVALNPKDLSGKLVPRIGFETALPIFQASAGIEADINIDNPLVGIYARIPF